MTFYNPEHVKAHEQLGYAYDETLNGTKAISHILISQRFLVEQKMMKQLAESRDTLHALYKKYKMGPEDFKNVTTPPEKTTSGAGPAANVAVTLTRPPVAIRIASPLC